MCDMNRQQKQLKSGFFSPAVQQLIMNVRDGIKSRRVTARNLTRVMGRWGDHDGGLFISQRLKNLSLLITASAIVI